MNKNNQQKTKTKMGKIIDYEGINWDDFKEIDSRYMMATKAHHKMGDISRNNEDICAIFGDDEKNDAWVGNWITGLGFIHVRFPKATTREPTEEEIRDYISGYYDYQYEMFRDMKLEEGNDE